MSLYAITSEMSVLLDLAYAHGAQSPELDAALSEHLGALSEAFDAKAENYAALIRECEARAEARAGEAERMRRLAQTDSALAARLRDTLRDAMVRVNRTTVQTERFRLAVRQNGGSIPVVIEDESALPGEFLVPQMTVKPDRDAIRQALEAGKPVSGARLGQRGTRLDLR